MMRFNFEEIEQAVNSDEYIGYCLACGAQHYGVEPDARNYECEECEQLKVYGAEEIVMMGLAD